MYNVKRIGVWKYEAKMSRDWPPPHSEPPPPHLPEASIEGSVYHQPQPGTEVDIPVTAGGCQVSRRVYKGSERGIEKGARGISKGKRRARGLHHVYCNLYMCT
jgi:hypothetical protein